ncbi:MAG TPA: ester cyclase [Chloroflexota bacterium]|nr:ester cyclase [Chloroflexota bacterium]
MAEDAKTVVRRFMDEVWNHQNPGAGAEILAEDVRWYNPSLGDRQGREAVLAAIAEMRAAYPDLALTVKTMLAEGDQVVTYWAATGTRRHPYRGAPPTGQQVTWEGAALSRVADGRIVEHRAFPHPTPGSPHEVVSRAARPGAAGPQPGPAGIAFLDYTPPRRFAAGARVGNVVYLAGETPRDPNTGETVAGDIHQQVDLVFQNIERSLRAFGTDLAHVFKITVYLTDMANIAAVSAARQRYLPRTIPSTTVAISRLAAPEFLVEIDAMALVPEA